MQENPLFSIQDSSGNSDLSTCYKVFTLPYATSTPQEWFLCKAVRTYIADSTINTPTHQISDFLFKKEPEAEIMLESHFSEHVDNPKTKEVLDAQNNTFRLLLFDGGVLNTVLSRGKPKNNIYFIDPANQ